MASIQNYRFIKFEQREEGIGLITLNRPEVLNALTDPMVEEITSVLETMELDLSSKVVIIKGEGPSFSSGWDLGVAGEMMRVRTDPSKLMFDELRVQLFSPLRKLLRLLWESPVISLAQVHGYAVESGIAIAMMCDLVIAAEDARFLWRPIGGAGMLWHLWPWTIGLRKTKELLFKGEYVTGKEAEQMGMINKSVPLESLEEEVNKWAGRLAERPREFLYLDKVSTNRAFEMMGLHTACEAAVITHVLSHETKPSTELNKKFLEGTTKEVIEALEKRFGRSRER